MDTRSFRQDLGAAPHRYRTPSPPLYEPISPIVVPRALRYPENFHFSSIAGGRVDTQPTGYTQHDGRREARRGELDAFASIALATNESAPTVGKLITQRWNANQATQALQEFDERPSKRARSEKAASPDWRHVESRPVTSYVQPSDTRRLEAELLLNFSRGACLAMPTTPIQIHHQASTNADDAISQRQMAHENTNTQGSPIIQRATVDDEGFNDVQKRERVPYIQSAPNIIPYKSYLNGIVDRATGDARQGTIDNDRIGIVPDRAPPPYDGNGVSKEALSQISVADFGSNETPLRALEESGKLIPIHGEKDSDAENYAPSTTLESPSNVHMDHQPEVQLGHAFLEGIVEAAKMDSSDVLDSPINQVPMLYDSTPTSLPSQKDVKDGSVCAACKFSRNLFTENDEGSTSWIKCDGCKSWFHFACAGFRSERDVRAVDKYRCRACKVTHGPTTFVRKSSRAHSAIDYAGLNEGVVKTSDEDPEHHYIKHFRNGFYKFHPEFFARMRPELVTADYFEKGDGMKEPVVIPAAFNPRPRPLHNLRSERGTDDTDESLSTVNELHDRSAIDQWLAHDYEYAIVRDQGQDALDMVIPHGLTVRRVSELYGPDEKIEVIDVKSQNGEDKKWNMRRWVDYYESKGSKVVRNVISLEISWSKLGRLIRRPKVVRDLDLQDAVWPKELIAKGEFPKVQFYCLMSVADCYTDFHIDFGGSSVYYHIVKGKKTFFFIPPHEKNLKKYEEWCNSPAQNWTFLGSQVKECYRVDLAEGDTMLIPAGWIHAVWTPEDSLVIGGNFLTRLHYQMQIRVAQIEKATNVARKFRYPYFQKVQWYAALKYLDDDPIPESVVTHLTSGQSFDRSDLPTHHDFDGWGDNRTPGTETYHARYYSKAELDQLPELGRYLQRTALIAAGGITDGISAEARTAVRRSIPKNHGHGEPLDVVKKFAMWYTWKRGNEHIPHWAYPGYVPEGGAPELTEKKLSAKAVRKLDREAAYRAYKIAPDRQSTRPRTQPQNLLAEIVANQASSQTCNKESPAPSTEVNGTIKRKLDSAISKEDQVPMPSSHPKKQRTSTGTKPTNRRPACEACRKSRRACKHRDDPLPPPPSTSHPEPYDGSTGMDLTPQKGPSSIASVQTTEYSPNTVDSTILDELNTHTPQKSRPFEEHNEESLVSNSLDTSNEHTNKENSQLKTPGRTKACKDCRKSKVSILITTNSEFRIMTYYSGAVFMTSLGTKTPSNVKVLQYHDLQLRKRNLPPYHQVPQKRTA